MDDVTEWYVGLAEDDPGSAESVALAINALEAEGPTLGGPLVDSIRGLSIKNMKELRPGSRGRTEIQIPFVFDLARQAVLLVAGDKAGNWSRWYSENIPIAKQRYARWLAGDYAEERGG